MRPTLAISIVLGIAVVGSASLALIGRSPAPEPAPEGMLQQRSAIPVLTADSFVAARGSGTWLIVEFGGATCIPCKAMQPTLQELQVLLGDKAQIRNFWIADYPDTARGLGIMVMPTQIVFDPAGKEVLRHQGGYPLNEFRTALANAGL